MIRSLSVGAAGAGGQRVGGALILRGELEHVPATIFVGLARGGLTELVRALAIRTGTARGEIGHARNELTWKTFAMNL